MTNRSIGDWLIRVFRRRAPLAADSVQAKVEWTIACLSAPARVRLDQEARQFVDELLTEVELRASRAETVEKSSDLPPNVHKMDIPLEVPSRRS